MSEKMKENSKQRDYDKEPLTTINYSVLFESHLILIIALFALPILVSDIYKVGELTVRLSTVAVAWGCLLYLVFIKIPNQFRKKNSFFLFGSGVVHYCYKHLIIQDDDIKLSVKTSQISTISYCIVCELPESYGRLHYLTSWQLYRKSSIGVHIGKLVLFIRFTLTYLFFVLPYKLYRLTKEGESYGLLKKNLFIQFANRNYFLVNIYSQKELNELIEYFHKHNILIDNKTRFIPHLQDQGWFVDKNEIWSEDFDDTQIPKDTFTKKARRFFSFE